jgi:hypothetical protein
MIKIKNYTELLAERRRLEEKITQQQATLNQGLLEFKEKLSPLFYLLPALTIFKKRTSEKPLLQWIVSSGIELFLGQNGVAKSNWLVRLVSLFAKPENSESK